MYLQPESRPPLDYRGTRLYIGSDRWGEVAGCWEVKLAFSSADGWEGLFVLEGVKRHGTSGKERLSFNGTANEC
jgi:hypothetical protein